jgi:DnaJ-class molecular chaperone
VSIKYNDLIEARELLDLPERATMEEIKSRYKKLITQWHPDKCKESEENCNEMSRKIIAAYKIIIAYCDQYRYSFSDDEIMRYLKGDEWWNERFGHDPLWGSGEKP